MGVFDIPLATRGEAMVSAGNALIELLLIGPWERLSPLAARFHASGHSVLLAPEAATAERQLDGRRFHLAIAAVESLPDIAAVTGLVRKAGCPWLALDAGTLMTEAYASGAVCVLPAAADPELVERAASTLMTQLGGVASSKIPRSPIVRRRRYHSGDPIVWNPEQVLLVEEGILARVALHADGTEALIGFVAAGDLVVEPREDLFSPALFACSDVEVTALSWEAATKLAHFPARLRDQLAWTEAWSAARSCLHLEDRLTSILELLSRQFGRPHPQGVLVDFRVTHSQLAQAVGATRSTVTRLLARLRREGWLLTTVDPGGERLIVHGPR